MAGRAPSKKDFNQVLNMGAQVDDIFKDDPVPRGSNPYDSLVSTPAPETAATQTTGSETPVVQLQVTPPAAVPTETPEIDVPIQIQTNGDSGIVNENFFTINRKLAATEALFRLVGREYYSFGQLISEILRVAMEEIRSESGSFLEIDYNNKNMFFRAASGRSSENLFNFTVPMGKGLVGYVCESQQPAVLSSIDESGVYLRAISDAVGFETRNVVAYPVVIRGATFGCIELLNRIGEAQYSEADKEVLATIAEHAAKVIENRLVMAALTREIADLKGSKAGEEAA